MVDALHSYSASREANRSKSTLHRLLGMSVSRGPAESVLTQEMHTLLADLFDCVESEPAGVNALRFRANHEESLEILDTMVRIGAIEKRDRVYLLTLSGIAELASANHKAERLMYVCSQLFIVLRAEYRDDPERTYTILEVAELVKMPEGQVLNAFTYLRQANIFSSIATKLSDTTASFTLSEEVIRKKSFSQVVAQQRSWLSQNIRASEVTALPDLASADTDKNDKSETDPDQDRSRRDVLPEGLRSATRESDSTQGHCPACGPDRRAEILAKHMETWEDRSVSGSETYAVLRCGGCAAIYFQRVSECSEDMDFEYNENGETVAIAKPRFSYWPLPFRRARPLWIETLKDDSLREVLAEVYGALDADHRILAAIGARTALDRAMVLLGATDYKSFAAKLEELVSSKFISDHERQILGVLTDAGSASAHRGWRPTPENLATIMDGTENFLHRTLVVGKAANAMKRKVPRRSRRRPKAS